MHQRTQTSEPIPQHASSGAGLPADAPHRLGATLRALKGRRVAVVIDPSTAGEFGVALSSTTTHIVAFVCADARGIYHATDCLDAQPATFLRGRPLLLGRPVVLPDEIYLTGATDVVLSIWPDDERIWTQRAMFLRQSVSVHRVFNGTHVTHGLFRAA